jgi:hypothetical protein
MVERRYKRRGLTLAELLIASTIMLLIAGAVGTLASTVKATNEYCQGYTLSAQHARVALSRIERAVIGAFANEQFPGCLVVPEQAGSQSLPHTLVIWYPATGTVVNAAGLPLISEIVVYGFDPAHPNNLIEVRSPTEMTAVPAASDSSGWKSLTDRLKSSTTVTKTVLTDRLRTAPLTGDYSDTLSPSDLRGAVRFRRLMAPSDSEWSQYKGGTKSWQSLSWPLDSYRTTSGTRAVACQTELQIAPGSMSSAAATAIPFYGSASIQYELAR